MQSRRLAAGTAVAALAAAVALFIVLRDDDSDQEPAPTTSAANTTAPGGSQDGNGSKAQKPEKPEVPTIEVRGGQPVGGVAELSFDKGETIKFVVSSDVADHVHLHGYDVFQDVAAGGEARFSVPATIDGVFEVELEDRVVPLAEITVNP